ncbi:MAG: hypothetical protein A2044_00925 [Candidatus Firestonebacteria bacterium GWA2_43_8]|nr:MAG: hypothetical protein A2044_00925 [Candidatus Firestonebacteria bacterium GWA2_43_8]
MLEQFSLYSEHYNKFLNVAHKSQKTGKLLLFLLSAKSFYFISGIKPEIFELIDIFIVFADDFG